MPTSSKEKEMRATTAAVLMLLVLAFAFMPILAGFIFMIDGWFPVERPISPIEYFTGGIDSLDMLLQLCLFAGWCATWLSLATYTCKRVLKSFQDKS